MIVYEVIIVFISDFDLHIYRLTLIFLFWFGEGRDKCVEEKSLQFDVFFREDTPVSC